MLENSESELTVQVWFLVALYLISQEIFLIVDWLDQWMTVLGTVVFKSSALKMMGAEGITRKNKNPK